MILLLSKIFIKDRENTSSPQVRKAYGMLCGGMGIALNILLFAGKFLAGFLSNSIAITADAFNNLSDAGSSLITLVGFQMAGQKPDPHHPFGHGRIEYLSGLFVSVALSWPLNSFNPLWIKSFIHSPLYSTHLLSLSFLYLSRSRFIWLTTIKISAKKSTALP